MRRLKKPLLITITTLFLSLTTGCIAPEREKMENVNPLGWGATEGISMAIENDDTLSRRDIFVVIRANDRFSLNQLPLVITTEDPDGLSFEESYILKDVRPTNTLATIWEAQMPYRLNAILSRKGSYQFSFTPSDGVVIEGVVAIGIKIMPADSGAEDRD